MIPLGTPTARCSARCNARARSSGSTRELGDRAESGRDRDLERRGRRESRADRQRRAHGSLDSGAGRPSAASSASTAADEPSPRGIVARAGEARPTSSDVRCDGAQSRRTPRSSATGKTSPPTRSVNSPMRLTRPGAQNARQPVIPRTSPSSGRKAVSRMRWFRGRVRTKSTTSATSSERHHPRQRIRRAAAARVESEVGRDAARADVRAANAVLAQLVIERAREADLAELRGAVTRLVRQPAAPGLGCDRDDVGRRPDATRCGSAARTA